MMHRNRWVLLGGTGAVLAVVASLMLWGSGTPAPVSTPGGAAPGAAVERGAVATGAAHYEVSGDGPAIKIHYTIVDDESQALAVPLPWVKSTGANWMSVVAQRGPGPGSITCKITGHGQVLATQTVEGPYATCIANGYPEKPPPPPPAERKIFTRCGTCIKPDGTY